MLLSVSFDWKLSLKFHLVSTVVRQQKDVDSTSVTTRPSIDGGSEE